MSSLARTLFTKLGNNEKLFIVHLYVDDIRKLLF